MALPSREKENRAHVNNGDCCFSALGAVGCCHLGPISHDSRASRLIEGHRIPVLSHPTKIRLINSMLSFIRLMERFARERKKELHEPCDGSGRGLVKTGGLVDH